MPKNTDPRWDWYSRPQGDEMATSVYSNSISAGPKYGRGANPYAVQNYMGQHGVNPTDMGMTYGAAEQMVDPGSGFWSGLLEKSMKVFDVLAIPQQIGYQLITGGDWRKAIPDFWAKDEWQELGLHHEIIGAKDVLNIWSDNALDEWYQSNNILAMASEAVFKTGLFVADVFTDPLTYVPMGAAVKVARKTLPIGLQAEMTGKLAARTFKVEHANEALDTARRFLTHAEENYAAKGTDKALGIRDAARKHLAEMEEHAAVVEDARKLYGNDVTLVEKPAPKGMPRFMVTGSVFNNAERHAHQAAAKIDYQTVLKHNPTWDEVGLHNAAMLGPDDATVIGDGMGQLVVGADQIYIHTPRASHHFNSMDTTPLGVITGSGIDLLEKYNKWMNHADDLDDGIIIDATSILRSAASEVGKLDKLAEKIANGTIKASDVKDLKVDDAAELIKDLKAANRGKAARVKWREELAEKRVPPKALIEAADKDDWVKILPSSARRSPLQADDYIESQFGKFASRVAGVALYPKSVMPKPAGWFNHVFREPTRVLAEQVPEMRQVLMDGMKEYNYFLNYTRGETHKILSKAGVMQEKGAKATAGKFFMHNFNGTINKEKAAELTELLDVGIKPGMKPARVAELQAAHAEKLAAASPEMREAHDEMRDLLNAMAQKLNVPPDMFIEGYVPHLRDYSQHFMRSDWFKMGKRPPDFEGLPAKVKFDFGHLKERKGLEIEELDIAHIMDVYTRGAARKAFLDPMEQNLRVMAQEVATMDPSKEWLLRFTDDLLKDVNGVPSALSTIAERMIGTDKSHLAKGAAGMMASLGYSAALTGNLRYPVMSVLQALNTTSAKYGPLRTLRGLAKVMWKSGTAEAKAAGLDNEITQVYQGISSWASRLRGPGVPAIQQTELFIRGLTYHAALGDELARAGFKHLDDVADKKLKNRIVASAVRETEEANHVFGVIGRPVGFSRISRTGSTVATQFLSFPFKQTETLLNITGENPGVFLDYMYVAGKMQQRLAEDLNIDVKDYVGIGYATDLPEIFEGKRETIPLQALQNLNTFVTTLPKILDGGQPEEIQTLMKSIGESVEMMVPGKTGIEQFSRGVQELRGLTTTGSADVRRVRDTNLGAVYKAVTRGGSYNDYRFGELQYKKEQDDFASIFTGMNTIKGSIERKISERKYRATQRKAALQAKITEEIWDAVRTGNEDPAVIQPLVQQLRALGVKYDDLTGIKTRAARISYAANQTVKAREQADADPFEPSYSQFLRATVEGK